ncbi:signal peptide peptidase SppA [Paenalkalicoccus suaedae]|uniref:Signal peptide peptidase SppA n=1 Tax=Paenalkalicoccus suaedae TaxID=2592382 RepID=A0A859FGA6_9BACI|nr:signal peptide peptidase SppA [Paenalkalicoccus suaedae]QKS72061.1 signal peptide peptidase SppA [Paenalkalicoccus suaedae]
MNGKRWIALIAAASLLLFSSAISFFQAGLGSNMEEFFASTTDPVNERVIEPGTGRDKIAVLSLDGIIQGGAAGLFGGGYDHQLFLSQLDHAANDPNVSGVVLRVNTPGGGVVESDEIHRKIVELQEDFGKPVYVAMGSQAASGGYYVSAPAEAIYANPQTITGSLGVIMSSINFSGLAEDLGIEEQVIKSGPYKDIMSATREMTDDEREILQSIVDDAYGQFVDVIDSGRDNLSREQVLELADGRIYTGSQAAENGLIDGVGDTTDVIEALKENLGQPDITVVEYEPGLGFGSLLGSTLDGVFNQQAQLTDFLNQHQGPKLMYLYTD